MLQSSHRTLYIVEELDNPVKEAIKVTYALPAPVLAILVFSQLVFDNADRSLMLPV